MAKILIVGDPTAVLAQTRGLVGQRRGHHISWFSAQPASLPGVTHFTMPSWARHNYVMRTLLKPLYLGRALRTVVPDLVHVHYAQTGLIALQLVRTHPLIVTVMGGDIMPDQGYSGLPALSIRLLLDHADCLTSKSEFMDTMLDRIGSYRAKIRRVTWGVDLARFRRDRDVGALRSRWSIPRGDLIFFDPRQARPFYNKHIILQAFAGYIQAGGVSATLLVSETMADTAYLRSLKRQVMTLGIADKVRFVGSIPHEAMPDYHALADISVSVPPSDGLPQTIYEAFAGGSFLILGNLPQYAEVVEDGVTARLVTVGEVQPLMDALLWASINPGVRERARSVGRAYVQEHCDFERQAALVNEIYAELLGEAEPGGPH